MSWHRERPRADTKHATEWIARASQEIEDATQIRRILMGSLMEICARYDALERSSRALELQRSQAEAAVHERQRTHLQLQNWTLILERQLGPERVKALLHLFTQSEAMHSRPRFRVKAPTKPVRKILSEDSSMSEILEDVRQLMGGEDE